MHFIPIPHRHSSDSVWIPIKSEERRRKDFPLLDGWSEYIDECKDVNIDRPCVMVVVDVGLSS